MDRLINDLNGQKQNIRRAKLLLEKRVNQQKDLARDIERSNKNTRDVKGEKIKSYLSGVKLKLK